MARILAVDDEKDILALIQNSLALDGHMVTVSAMPAQVLGKPLHAYDLILLDIAMPEMDGFTLCRRIREQTDCPILFLTARVQETDVVYGLGLGADDYIRKPFSTAELRARVSAHLRRESREKKHVMRLGPVSFDLMGKQISAKGQTLGLTPGEYGICLFLARHKGQVFSKEKIYETVFGFERDSNSAVITEHVRNIRAKFAAMGVAPIETVWGIGYKWQG